MFLFLAAPLEGANIQCFSSSLFQSVSLLSSSGFVFRSRLFSSAPAPSLRGFLACFWQVTYFRLLGPPTRSANGGRLGAFLLRRRRRSLETRRQQTPGGPFILENREKKKGGPTRSCSKPLSSLDLAGLRDPDTNAKICASYCPLRRSQTIAAQVAVMAAERATSANQRRRRKRRT